MKNYYENLINSDPKESLQKYLKCNYIKLEEYDKGGFGHVFDLVGFDRYCLKVWDPLFNLSSKFNFSITDLQDSIYNPKTGELIYVDNYYNHYEQRYQTLLSFSKDRELFTNIMGYSYHFKIVDTVKCKRKKQKRPLYFFVMEKYGKSINKLDRQLTPEEIFELGKQVSAQLKDLHTYQNHEKNHSNSVLCHNDIKPGNIVMGTRLVSVSTEQTIYRLVDFDDAFYHSIDGNSTTTRDYVVKNAFTSLDARKGKPSPQSDIYSFALTLLSLLLNEDEFKLYFNMETETCTNNLEKPNAIPSPLWKLISKSINNNTNLEERPTALDYHIYFNPYYRDVNNDKNDFLYKQSSKTSTTFDNYYVRKNYNKAIKEKLNESQYACLVGNPKCGKSTLALQQFDSSTYQNMLFIDCSSVPRLEKFIASTINNTDFLNPGTDLLNELSLFIKKFALTHYRALIILDNVDFFNPKISKFVIEIINFIVQKTFSIHVLCTSRTASKELQNWITVNDFDNEEIQEYFSDSNFNVDNIINKFGRNPLILNNIKLLANKTGFKDLNEIDNNLLHSIVMNFITEISSQSLIGKDFVTLLKISSLLDEKINKDFLYELAKESKLINPLNCDEVIRYYLNQTPFIVSETDDTLIFKKIYQEVILSTLNYDELKTYADIILNIFNKHIKLNRINYFSQDSFIISHVFDVINLHKMNIVNNELLPILVMVCYTCLYYLKENSEIYKAISELIDTYDNTSFHNNLLVALSKSNKLSLLSGKSDMMNTYQETQELVEILENNFDTPLSNLVLTQLLNTLAICSVQLGPDKIMNYATRAYKIASKKIEEYSSNPDDYAFTFYYISAVIAINQMSEFYRAINKEFTFSKEMLLNAITLCNQPYYKLLSKESKEQINALLGSVHNSLGVLYSEQGEHLFESFKELYLAYQIFSQDNHIAEIENEHTNLALTYIQKAEQSNNPSLRLHSLQFARAHLERGYQIRLKNEFLFKKYCCGYYLQNYHICAVYADTFINYTHLKIEDTSHKAEDIFEVIWSESAKEYGVLLKEIDLIFNECNISKTIKDWLPENNYTNFSLSIAFLEKGLNFLDEIIQKYSVNNGIDDSSTEIIFKLAYTNAIANKAIVYSKLYALGQQIENYNNCIYNFKRAIELSDFYSLPRIKEKIYTYLHSSFNDGAIKEIIDHNDFKTLMKS